MRAAFIPEPELSFGCGAHLDIRFGLANHSPLDVDSSAAGPAVRLGLVGPASCTEPLQAWIERISRGVEAKPSGQPNLFAPFCGFGDGTPLPVPLVVSEVRPISNRRISELPAASPDTITRAAVELYAEEIGWLSEQRRIDLALLPIPARLLELLAERRAAFPGQVCPDFHDLLKAKAMGLDVPTQLVLPATYGGARPAMGAGHEGRVQDEATRAWNMYVAAYYKAGGRPWRLKRMFSDYTTLYIGVSFYRTVDRERIHTALAHIFNERGEGIIVRGAQARIASDGRTPYLTESDAHKLLVGAFEAYRREHAALPARAVVHKTSRYQDCELVGFKAAIREQRVELCDLVSLRVSDTRAFRLTGRYPPARGTLITLDQQSSLLYTRGSVPFYETYPGAYVPRAIELRLADAEGTHHQLASEILALTKLNWNDTQLDGFHPITTHAARQVGGILKHISVDQSERACYAYYM